MGALLNQLDHQTTDLHEKSAKVKRLRLVAQILVMAVVSGGVVLGITLYQHQALMRPLASDTPSELTSRQHQQRDYKARWGQLFPQLRPNSFNGVEIWTCWWELDGSETVLAVLSASQ